MFKIEHMFDIKFDGASRNNISEGNINNIGEEKMSTGSMLDVREIDVVTAKKDHTCNFSGREIKDGDQYFSITYTNENGDHRTYRVEYDEFQQFVKEKLFMEPGYDYTAMEGDIDMLVGHVRQFYDKYGDVPGVKDRVKRIRNLLKD